MSPAAPPPARGRSLRAVTWPTLEQEALLWERGYRRVAGVDEAGRGAWAGPVVAAAVVLPSYSNIAQLLEGLHDSKLLSPAARERLYPRIIAQSLGVGLGVVEAWLVDAVGLAAAGQLALGRAVDALSAPPDYLLVDHFHLASAVVPQLGLTKGDARCLSIAAASIVAKVTRDRLMVGLHRQYPGYAFDRHKGYGTAAHRAALRSLGPCGAHRQTYRPVQALGRC